MNKYFISTPDAENAADLLENLNTNILKRLIYNINYIEKKLNINLKFLKLKILQLDATKKLCSGIAIYEAQISLAYTASNLGLAIDLINELSIYLQNYSAPKAICIGAILENYWEKYAVQNLRDQMDGANGEFSNTVIIRPPIGVALEREKEDVKFILTKIEELDNGLYTELETYVSYIKFFTGQTVVGATSKQNFGTIILRMPPKNCSQEDIYRYYIEHLTHEVSHLQLHAIMDIDPIVANGDTERFDAPIRRDPRPMYGIFHATFVLSRVVRMLRKFHDASICDTTAIHQDMSERFVKGYNTVKKHAKLTDAGRMIFNTLQETAGISA